MNLEIRVCHVCSLVDSRILDRFAEQQSSLILEIKKPAELENGGWKRLGTVSEKFRILFALRSFYSEEVERLKSYIVQETKHMILVPRDELTSGHLVRNKARLNFLNSLFALTETLFQEYLLTTFASINFENDFKVFGKWEVYGRRKTKEPSVIILSAEPVPAVLVPDSNARRSYEPQLVS